MWPCSPHLDDAVLSLGAAIVDWGEPVRIVTVLAGDPTSTRPAGPWDRESGFRTEGEAATARREEDRRACAAVGAAFAWLPFGDEQYERRGDDDRVWDAIVQALGGARTVLVPGFPLRHRDHRWLSELAVRRRDPAWRLAFYVEQPYALRRAPGPRGRSRDGQGPLGAALLPDADLGGRAAEEAARVRHVPVAARTALPGCRNRPAGPRPADPPCRAAARRRDGRLPSGGSVIAAVRAAIARRLPVGVRRRLRPLLGARGDTAPRVGSVRLGDLARTTPFSSRWGFDRGTPVDRVYIEAFLERHRTDVRGRVLEVADDGYTRRFGSGVTAVDVLSVSEDNPDATIVADLADAPQIPDGTFDCAIVTQTLQYVWDLPGAVATLHRILAPEGVALVTVPSVIGLDPGRWPDLWRFTPASAERLFSE